MIFFLGGDNIYTHKFIQIKQLSKEHLSVVVLSNPGFKLCNYDFPRNSDHPQVAGKGCFACSVCLF